MNLLIDGHRMGKLRFIDDKIDKKFSFFLDQDRMKLKQSLMMSIVEHQFDVIYVMIVQNLVKKKQLNVRK
jgi:hypothetical protein